MRSATPRALTHCEAGFTLAEVLAAMMIMAIVLPLLVEGAALANRVGTVAQRERRAAMLAESKLNECAVTEVWRDGDSSGDFAPGNPDYTWRLTTNAWDEDTMRMLRIEVSFMVQGEEYTTSVSTLVPEEASTTSTSSTGDSASSGASSSSRPGSSSSSGASSPSGGRS